ncbi:MAG: hypothetical protein RIK87_00560 [Fuerstiella sp.]
MQFGFVGDVFFCSGSPKSCRQRDGAVCAHSFVLVTDHNPDRSSRQSADMVFQAGVHHERVFCIGHEFVDDSRIGDRRERRSTLHSLIMRRKVKGQKSTS